MKADRNAIEQAYAFFHEHTAFQEDLTKAVCMMEKWLELKTSISVFTGAGSW